MLKITVRTHTCRVIKAAYITPSTLLPKILREAVDTFVSAHNADFTEIRYTWGIVRISDYEPDVAAFDCASLIRDLSDKETRLQLLREHLRNHD